MKKIFVLITLIMVSLHGFSQCREYIESIAESELEPYILDGNFLSPIVSEGETVTLTRTFIAGQSYKIAVCGMDMFFKEITIKEDKTVLFKNFGKEAEDKQIVTSDGITLPMQGLNFYEFTPERSQTLKITIKVVPFDGGSSFKLEGCLGLLIGFKK